MSDLPKEDEFFEALDVVPQESDTPDEVDLADLVVDERIDSGVPLAMRLSEDDFLLLSGITRTGAASSMAETSSEVEPDLAERLSFAEPGVADVEETDESEPLFRGEALPPEPEPVETPEFPLEGTEPLPSDDFPEAEPEPASDPEPAPEPEAEPEEAGDDEPAPMPEDTPDLQPSSEPMPDLEHQPAMDESLHEVECAVPLEASLAILDEDARAQDLLDNASELMAELEAPKVQDASGDDADHLVESAEPEAWDAATGESYVSLTLDHPEALPTPDPADQEAWPGAMPDSVVDTGFAQAAEDFDTVLAGADADVEAIQAPQLNAGATRALPKFRLDEAELLLQQLSTQPHEPPTPQEVHASTDAVTLETVEAARQDTDDSIAEVGEEAESEPIPSRELEESLPADTEALYANTPLAALGLPKFDDNEPLKRPLAEDEPHLLSHPEVTAREDGAENVKPSGRHSSNRGKRRRKKFLMRAAALLLLGGAIAAGALGYQRVLAPRVMSADELYALAQRQLAERDYDAAATTLERFIAAAPGHPLRADAQFDAALALQMLPHANAEEQRSRTQEALGLLSTFIAENAAHKKMPRARTLAGLLLLEVGQYDEAIVALRALAANLEDPLAELPALRGLAQAYAQQGALSEAESTWLQAATLPRNLTPEQDYYSLGELYANRVAPEGDSETRRMWRDKAESYFAQAAESPGVDPESRSSLEQRVAMLRRDVVDGEPTGKVVSEEAPAPERQGDVEEMVAPADAAMPMQEIDPMREAQQLGHGETP